MCLTRNAHAHRECVSSPRMNTVYTGGFVTAERSKSCDTMSFVKLYYRNKDGFSGGNENL